MAKKDPLQDPYPQASIDLGSRANKNYADKAAFQEPSTMRRDFFNQMKKLSRRGKLTKDVYDKAKDQLGKYEGVSSEQFDSTMSKNFIRPSNFAQTAQTSSPEEAAQNVQYQKQFGSGLSALSAMQDPNYELGSGSSLRQPARQIGTKSGMLRRASRRLRKQGYGAQAGQMAMASEVQRLNEPSIVTPATRAADMAGRIEAGRLRQQEDQLMSERASLFGNRLNATRNR